MVKMSSVIILKSEMYEETFNVELDDMKCFLYDHPQFYYKVTCE